MNVRDTVCVWHSFSIKNIFYDKMNLRHFLFSCDKLIIICNCIICRMTDSQQNSFNLVAINPPYDV